MQELAKRFAVMFGLDAVKNREALTALHRAGVSFAALDGAPHAPGPHLLFLDALAEFSPKLLRQDKRHVLKVRPLSDLFIIIYCTHETRQINNKKKYDTTGTAYF